MRSLICTTALGSVLATTTAWAAPISTIDFDVASDLTDNFTVQTNQGTLGVNTTDEVLRFTSANSGQGGVIRTIESSLLTETISADVSWSNNNSWTTSGGPDGIGLISRINTSATNQPGIMGNVDLYGTVNQGGSGTGGTTMRLRLFGGAQTVSGSTNRGTQFGGTTTLDLSANPIANNEVINIVFEQTNEADPVFTLSAYRGGNLLGSVSAAYTADDNYNTAGAGGVRFFTGTGSDSLNVDNYSAVIPEPGSFACLLAGGMLMLYRKR